MRVGNTEAEGWKNWGSVSTNKAVGPLLNEIYILNWHLHVHSFICHTSKEENFMAGSNSRLIHLLESTLLANLCFHFPHTTLWRLIPLPSKCRQNLTSMMHAKKYPKVFFLVWIEGRHCLGKMARLLWLSTHINQPPLNQRPHSISTNICRVVPPRPLLHKLEPHLQAFHQKIPIISWPDSRSRGGQ